MRFIDFISFADYSFSSEDTFVKLMRKFLMSHTLRPYTEAIMRDPDQTEFFRTKILPLFQEYWKQIEDGAFSEAKNFYSSFDNPLTKDSLKNIALIASHDPAAIAISSQIIELVVNNGKICLQQEHDLALKAAFGRYLKGEFISFDTYMRIYFSDNYDRTFSPSGTKDKITITLQQFISYFGFVISIIKPYAELPLESENQRQAIDICNNIYVMENHINHYNEELKELIEELESIELKIHQYQKYNLEHSNEPPPEGHDKNCNATVTYEGIVSSWKMFMKIDELKKFYEYKQEQYIKKLHFMSDSDGNLNKENTFIKSFFEKLNYWQQNIPLIHKRRLDVHQLYEFKPIAAVKQQKMQGDILYRNITEGEYNSIIKLKQFSQKKKEGSFEREKWFYQPGGNPGHSSGYDYQSTISLEPGALLLLNKLKKNAGNQTAVIMKENEYQCIGIHEDVLPFFNNLVSKVELINTKTNKKQEITFSKLNGPALQLMMEPYQVGNPLFFLEPYTNYTGFSSPIPEITIKSNDVDEFEDWIERNMTYDPSTGKPVHNHLSILAYSYTLQMSCYGPSLPRRTSVRRGSDGKVTLKTVEYNYCLQEIPVKQDNVSLINAIPGNNITRKILSQKLNDLYRTDSFIMPLIMKSLINSKENKIYNNISDKNYENIVDAIKQYDELLKNFNDFCEATGAEVMNKITLHNAIENNHYEAFVQKVSLWAQTHKAGKNSPIVKYMQFVEKTDFLDIRLVESYLYTVGIKLNIFYETENGFIIRNNIPSHRKEYRHSAHIICDNDVIFNRLVITDKTRHEIKKRGDYSDENYKNLINTTSTNSTENLASDKFSDLPSELNADLAAIKIMPTIKNNKHNSQFFALNRDTEEKISTNKNQESSLSKTLNHYVDHKNSKESSKILETDNTEFGRNTHSFFNESGPADHDFFNEFSDDFNDDDLEFDSKI